MISLSIFNGRNNANDLLEDGGFDGPIIQNVGFAWTYGLLKIFDIRHDGTFGDMIFIPTVHGLLMIDHKFYSDFEVVLPTDKIALNPDRQHLSFTELKQLIGYDK